jgi:hypothetical protein
MKDKAEMMRRVRKERREEGKVELRVWLTQVEREKVKQYIESIQGH